MDSTNCGSKIIQKKKFYVVVDKYYCVLRPTVVVSVLNRYRLQYSVSIIYTLLGITGNLEMI